MHAGIINFQIQKNKMDGFIQAWNKVLMEIKTVSGLQNAYILANHEKNLCVAVGLWTDEHAAKKFSGHPLYKKLLEDSAQFVSTPPVREVYAISGSLDNESNARQLYDGFNHKTIDKAASLVSDEARWQNMPFNKTLKGKEGYGEYFQNWSKAFPDGKIEIKKVVALGDSVIVEFIGRGTHTGPFDGPMGLLPATGKSVEMTGVDVLEFKNGLLINARSYFDSATLMKQLGVESPMRKVA